MKIFIQINAIEDVFSKMLMVMALLFQLQFVNEKINSSNLETEIFQDFLCQYPGPLPHQALSSTKKDLSLFNFEKWSKMQNYSWVSGNIFSWTKV